MHLFVETHLLIVLIRRGRMLPVWVLIPPQVAIMARNPFFYFHYSYVLAFCRLSTLWLTTSSPQLSRASGFRYFWSLCVIYLKTNALQVMKTAHREFQRLRGAVSRDPQLSNLPGLSQYQAIRHLQLLFTAILSPSQYHP